MLPFNTLQLDLWPMLLVGWTWWGLDECTFLCARSYWNIFLTDKMGVMSFQGIYTHGGLHMPHCLHGSTPQMLLSDLAPYRRLSVGVGRAHGSEGRKQSLPAPFCLFNTLWILPATVAQQQGATSSTEPLVSFDLVHFTRYIIPFWAIHPGDGNECVAKADYF